MKFIKLRSNFINFALRFSSKMYRKEEKTGGFLGRKDREKEGKRRKKWVKIQAKLGAKYKKMEQKYEKMSKKWDKNTEKWGKIQQK